jgi:hypothetical protein
VESRSDLFKGLAGLQNVSPAVEPCVHYAKSSGEDSREYRVLRAPLEISDKFMFAECELTIFLPSRAPLGTDKIAFGRSAAWDLLGGAACNEAHTRDCSARDYLHGVSARCLGGIGSSAHLPTHRKAKDRWPRPLPYSRRHWDACGRRCHRRAISAPTVSDRSLPDRNRQRRRRHRYFGSIR